MSNYNHPYCTIDKLRISKANGIRFVYLTGEGSFFDGEDIEDNELYNDQSNCGFNWESFAQMIPCDGTVRFQFQWCDDLAPMVHVFVNNEFLYELSPTLAIDGDVALYEQEINFAGEVDLCGACVDIRIATVNYGGLSVYLNDSESSTFVRKSSSYAEYSIDEGFQPTDVSVFGTGAILGAGNGSEFKVYSFDGFAWVEIYTTSIGTFEFVKAFDENNWCFLSKSTLGRALYCKNGVVSEDTISDPSYFYGLNGADIDNLYAWSQVPFGQANVFLRQGGTWVVFYGYGETLQPAIGKRMIQIYGSNIYALFKRGADTIINSIGISSGYDEVVFDNSVYPSALHLTQSLSVLASEDRVFILDGTTWVQDEGFDEIRTIYSDFSDVTSLSVESESRILVSSVNRIYVKEGDTWSQGVSGEYPVGSSFFSTVDGVYETGHDYHAKSEPIRVSDDNECLVKVEYWNNDTYDGQSFCSGFRNVTYVQAQFTGFRPMEEVTAYVTSRNERKILSSNLAKIKTLDINYIPEYLHEILWRAFGMDNLLLDGVSYAKEGDYSIEDNAAKYSLWKASVELYKNLYKFTNSNCSNCVPPAPICDGIGCMVIEDTFIVS